MVPGWGQNWGNPCGISFPAWCWHTMLAISCRHRCDSARWRADSASLPVMSHLGTKSLLRAWSVRPSTLPGSPGKAAAGNFTPTSRPPWLSLRLRLLDRSWETTPSSPAAVISRSWGVFCLVVSFPPRPLFPFLCVLPAVPPVLSNLIFHFPLLLQAREFEFAHNELSFLASWPLWSGSLDRLVFLLRDRERKMHY